MKKLDPSELYDLDPARPDLQGVVLVQALDGFIDAGGARKLAADHLLSALDSRVVIEQAKGILAATNSVPIADAFKLLRKHARDHNATMQQVADAVVHLGLRI